MNQSRVSSGLIAGIIVAFFFGVALYIRVALPYGQVFVGDWIKFTGVDAYHFMRIVDNIVHNFPHLNSFDPYALYPGGGGTGSRTFFVYFLAGITWLVGLGAPTQHTVDIVGVYFPAVLGALTVIPVYFIGKALFNRWAGVIAAGLLAVFSGEFLGRSILGFTDYHSAEVLFTTITMLFLLLAIKSATQSGMTFKNVKSRDWGIIFKPFIYSLLAGIFLGVYFLTWMGALLFVLIIFAYLVVQFIIDHLRGRATDYLCFVSTITFIVALLIYLPASPDRMSLASFFIAILVPIVLAVISSFMASRGIKPIIYLAALLGIGLATLPVFYIINPALLETMMLKSIAIFRAWPMETTVYEMRPLLFPFDDFSLSVAWANFTTSFFLCFISLGILIHLIIKRGESDKTLFVVWSLAMLAATLSMRRFAYYFAVNMALLAGYLSWLLLEFSGFREKAAEPAEALIKGKREDRQKKRQRDISRSKSNPVRMTLGMIVVIFLVFYPNIGPLPGGTKPPISAAKYAPFAPSNAWCESLTWLKNNSPDPFGNPDFYHGIYEPPSTVKGYDYPQTAYGVTAWWDYGYWITRIGHRMPTSNPGVGQKGDSRFFSAQNEASATRIILERGWGSKYVIVDHSITTLVGGKFNAVTTLSGNRSEKFFDVYYQTRGDKLEPVILFYPEYYRSMVVRLYNFDGKQVVPKISPVISYEERISRDGQPYKEITSAKSIPSYEEAEAYISSQESGNYRIVSDDPFASPVPLQALECYKLVYSSESSRTMPSGGLIPEVKIFEYTPSPMPTVQTQDYRSIRPTSARLIGELLGLGTASEVTASFLWGSTEACDEGETIAEATSLPGRFVCDLSDLSPGTTYYYRAKAVGDGTSYGEVKSFTTTKPRRKTK
ncbi:MAG: oligosaccharyl transferase, archaeosortase A system-associated [Dehalococcoidia bacterium]|nr:oligosaccharyl transferase, archaeosortase A system-associated [Dehalococcoidia bacterium]